MSPAGEAAWSGSAHFPRVHPLGAHLRDRPGTVLACHEGMHQVRVPFNRQQLELLDRTIARGLAPDRAALLKLALREHAAKQAAAQPARTPR